MLYEVWKFEGKFDLDKLQGKEMVVSKSEIPIIINEESSKASRINIEEKISMFEFLRRKKLSEDEIMELAEYTVNNLIPNASKAEKENAKKNYLENVRKLEIKSFVFQLDKSAIIVCRNNQTDIILKYLNVKQNMVTNIFAAVGIPYEDFLLWICWVNSNSRIFPGITIRKITEDRTKDREYAARSQKELGGQQVMDSFDFNFRVGGGFPLNGLKFIVEDTNFGTHLEMGIFREDKHDPMVTISNFTVLNGRLKQLVNSSPNADTEIIKMNLAMSLLYGLAKEYKNDPTWKTSKPAFITSLMQNASQLFNGKQTGVSTP